MSRIKRVVLLVVSVAVLALTYAALDDITTGSEPSLVLEWWFVGAAAVYFSILAANALRRRTSGR